MKKKYIILNAVFCGIALFLVFANPINYTVENLPIGEVEEPQEPSSISFEESAGLLHGQPLLIQSALCDSIIASNYMESDSYSVKEIHSCVNRELEREKPEIDVLKKIISLWVYIDISGALNFSKKLDDQLNPYVLPAVVQVAAAIDAHFVLRWIEGSGLGDLFDIKQAYFRGLAETKPQSALEDILVASNMVEEERIILLASALEKWSEVDANQAIEWVEEKQIQSPHMADNLKQINITLLMKLIKQDDVAAESKILALEYSEDKNLLLQSLTKHLANMDEEFVIEWAQSLVGPKNRKVAISAALKYWVASDVSADRVVDMILAEPDDNIRQVIIRETVQLLADRNSKELASILLSFPEADHPTIISKITKTWMTSSYQETMAWVNTLPSGSSKDAAIYQVVTEGVYNFDRPEDALVMIEGISQPDLQFYARRQVFMAVARSDIDKAHRMLAEVSLSANEIRSIAKAFTVQH